MARLDYCKQLYENELGSLWQLQHIPSHAVRFIHNRLNSLDTVVHKWYISGMATSGTITYHSKAHRLAGKLKADIKQGRFVSGVILPTEVELAKAYAVSRMTIRKTLAMLEDNGEIQRLPQGGAVVKATQDGGAHTTRRQATNEKVSIAGVWAAEPSDLLNGIREGIKQYAEEAGLDVQIFLSSKGHEEALEVLNHIDHYGVDGVIVWPYANEAYASSLERLVKRDFPIVCVDRLIGNVWPSSVEVDNAAGIYQATHYLIEKYHRPAYIIRLPLEHKTNQDRYAGYCHAMMEAGFGSLIESYTIPMEVSDSDPTYWPMGKNWLPGFQAAERFLDRVEFPVSIICMNDMAAQGLYEAVKKRDLVIGKDIAATGFDDMLLARLLKPSLTTMRQPKERIGYEAGRLVHRLIRREVKPPVHIHLSVELIVRESA